MDTKIDIRIIKTRRAIKNAFFELMNEIGFQNVTVKKIIERAEINRSTFYAHYVDKFDLLEQVEVELLNGFTELGNHAPIESVINDNILTDSIVTYFNELATYVHENGSDFTLLLSEKGDPSFTNKLNEMFQSVWYEKDLVSHLSIPEIYAFSALIGIMTSLIAQWVKRDFKESHQEFVEIVFKLTKDIPKNIFE